MRLRVALVLLFGLACTRLPAAEKPSAAPPPAVVEADDCTFDTPLVPGIPGSPGHLFPSDINPNGASELAVLMRTMQRELTEAKEAVTAGASFAPMYPRYRKMRCAWPTALADRSKEYDALAQVYLGHVKALDARPADLPTAFNAMVQGCVGCHEVSCAGPLEAIEKLRIVQAP